MSFIRIDTDAHIVAGWLWMLAGRIPNDVLLASANQLAEEALELYGRTYRSWRHKPKFWKRVRAKHRQVQIVVGTDDQIYSFVDFGTSPHYIVAVDAPMLVYPEVYIPKTVPGVLDSGPASDQGPIIRRTWVRHPGAKARGFSEEIQKRIDKRAMPVLRSSVARWLIGRGAGRIVAIDLVGGAGLAGLGGRGLRGIWRIIKWDIGMK